MESTKREKLLISYKSRNKVAREKMALNAGFNSGEEFKKHLEKGIILEKANGSSPEIAEKKELLCETVNKSILVHNVHILDASGSMTGPKFRNALAGINSEVTELKADVENDYVQTFVSFSGRGDVQFHEFRNKVSLVPQIKISTRGMTALFEAIVVTLEKVMNSIPKNSTEKTIVKIFTDGLENQSAQEYHDRVKEVIASTEGMGITVTFVGTKGDVSAMTARLNLHDSNTLIHDNTAKGVKKAFKVSATATRSYSNSARAGQDVSRGFYKDLK